MKYAFFTIGIAGLVLVSGCTSGTTYGTGSSHEEQTLKSLTNMFALSSEKKEKIEYNARPDLVMPPENQALPTPAQEAAAEDQNWPVSPEERIAAIRAAAPEADDRSGEVPIEFLLSEKDGIRNSTSVYQRNLRRNEKDGGQFIEAIKRDAAGLGTNEKLRQKREQLTYSEGPQRKYLVEPPTEYRTPAATAEAGNTGFTDEEIERIKKENKRKERQNELGMWTDN